MVIVIGATHAHDAASDRYAWCDKEAKTMCYVVMLKGLGKVVMTERVFMAEKDAKRYAKAHNADPAESERGYFFIERCPFEK